MKNNDEIKYENFIKEFSELFDKYALYYEIDYDRIVTIYDRKTNKPKITYFEMDEIGRTDGFYVDKDDYRVFISYDKED